jgi:protein TonB
VNPTAAPYEAPQGIAPEPDIPADAPGAEGAIDLGIVSGPPVGLNLGAAPPPPPPPVVRPPDQPYPVGGRIDAPRRVTYVPPVYPEIARRNRVEGIVLIQAIIGPDGEVRDVRVLRSVALLDQAALEAVRQWRYTPPLLNGVPVPVIMTVTVSFQLKE